MGNENQAPKLPAWLNTVIAGVILATASNALLTWSDVNKLKTWKAETHPLEIEIMQNQQLTVMNSNTESVLDLRTEIMRLQGSINVLEARIEALEDAQ